MYHLRVIAFVFWFMLQRYCEKKLKKNLFAIVFLISFAIRVRWAPVVVAPALVLLLWWSLVFLRSLVVAPALVFRLWLHPVLFC